MLRFNKKDVLKFISLFSACRFSLHRFVLGLILIGVLFAIGLVAFGSETSIGQRYIASLVKLK